jgi:hypothetical protein
MIYDVLLPSQGKLVRFKSQNGHKSGLHTNACGKNTTLPPNTCYV